jgi:hypothetical protein
MISTKPVEAFLATVKKVYVDYKDLNDLDLEKDYIIVYNKNNEFHSGESGKQKNVSWLGAIEWESTYSITDKPLAIPFDKNNISYPIEGETVIILKIYDIDQSMQLYYLPFSRTAYPNYRQNYETFISSQPKEKETSTTNKSQNYGEASAVGANSSKAESAKPSNTLKFDVNEKIKLLKPYIGDTIITGRVGNSIRLSQGFSTKESAPSILIRNFQSEDETNSKIGKLAVEDINKDGSSLYMTSQDILVPFEETVKKEKKAYKEYPKSKELIGNQIYINSDRLIMSSKANEVIIFGKKNIGTITDGNFTIDSAQQFLVDAETGIEFTTKGDNQFVFTSDGKIYLGRKQDNKSVIKQSGNPDADIQQMVLGNKLIDLLNKLCQAMVNSIYTNSGGPGKLDPGTITNIVTVQKELRSILSNRNFLSK